MEQTDLNAAHLFVEVVRHGSFTRAARALDLPKSTLSRKVSELEARLGARLLQRTTRQLSLTDVGAMYHERVLRVVAELGEAESAVSSSQEVPRGILRVTAPPDLGMTILAWALPEFSRRFPEVELVLNLSGRTVDLVKEGVDVALRAGTLGDSSLIAKPLTSGSLALFASPEYALRHGLPASAAELSSHDFLVFGIAPEKRLVFDTPKGTVSTDVRGRIAIKDFGYLRLCAAGGGGIALLPNLLVAADLHCGRLVRVLADHTMETGVLHIAYPSREFLPPKTRVFVDYMVEVFADAGKMCGQGKPPCGKEARGLSPPAA